MELKMVACRQGRLSSFLKGELKMSTGLMNKLKWGDGIRVNGLPQHTDFAVQPGDTITVRLDEPAPEYPAQEGPLSILWEDDCLLAVDPILLTDFLTGARDHLCQDLDVTELLARHCEINDQQPPATIYLTQEQIERYEAARWRGLSWYGVTYGSPSVYLWDQPHAP